MEQIIHSFEAGRRGKPDEFESQIANIIVGYFIGANNLTRCDVRVNGGYSHKTQSPYLRISGEVTGKALETLDHEKELKDLIVNHYKYIYRTDLNPDVIEFDFTPQATPLATNENAGDIGTAIAVAYSYSPLNLPFERYISVGLRDLIDELYQQNDSRLKGLRADGKIEVSAIYEGTKFVELRSVAIATEHEKSLPLAELRDKLTGITLDYLASLSHKYAVDFGDPEIFINTAGDWNEGGWIVDAGSREAKSYRDGFSTYGVAEDSFSGEDPTKVSATATLLARQIAVSIVNNDMADFARVLLSYTIGKADPIINIFTNGSAKVDIATIEKTVKENFGLTISSAIKSYNLRDESYYRSLVESSDYFQSVDYAWNKPLNLN